MIILNATLGKPEPQLSISQKVIHETLGASPEKRVLRLEGFTESP